MPSGMLPRSINSPSASRRTPVARGVVKVGASMRGVDATPEESRTKRATKPKRTLFERPEPQRPPLASNFEKDRTLHLAIRVISRRSPMDVFHFCKLADGDRVGSVS